MTTLTFDVSELNKELDDLLAHRWSVWLVRSPTDPHIEQKVIAPPPCTSMLTWEFPEACEVSAVQLLCDAIVVKTWPLHLPMLPDDLLTATVVLT